jgi:hypothetical protein
LSVKKQIAAAVLAPLLVAAPSVAWAEQSFPYSCQWISEVTPDAVIRFTSTNGVGSYKGALLYKGKRLMAFQEGQSQGYGSNWWSTGGKDDPSGQVVVFAGNQVVRGTAGFWSGKRPKDTQRVLLVGMGSALYYGRDQRWRDDHTLLTAGEGFWRASSGCRSLL